MTLTGRDRRLRNEWRMLQECLDSQPLISCLAERLNPAGLPVAYRVAYDIPCFCGVEQMERLGEPGVVNAPLMADHFELLVTIPDNYPCVDAPPRYCFTPQGADGRDVAMPWHPNIRYFGMMAGRVCLNMPDTYASIAHAVLRIARYLTYSVYHAEATPPYPEDLTVARWVRSQAEPRGWLALCHKRIKSIAH